MARGFFWMLIVASLCFAIPIHAQDDEGDNETADAAGDEAIQPPEDASLAGNETAAPCSTGRYRSTISLHVYDPAVGDPDAGVPPGTKFEDLPEDWTDPESGALKSDFEPVEC